MILFYLGEHIPNSSASAFRCGKQKYPLKQINLKEYAIKIIEYPINESISEYVLFVSEKSFFSFEDSEKYMSQRIHDLEEIWGIKRSLEKGKHIIKLCRDEMDRKICERCKNDLPISDFYSINSHGSAYYKSYCKECSKKP